MVQLEQNYVCSITPTEFEKYCKEILLGYAEEEKLHDFSITHNTKIEARDGVYQIDIYATFTAMGVDFKVLCECKQYSSPVSREKVVILKDKLNALGAHKGILLSTSRFQSGAIQYAKEHGIALIQVFDKECVQHSFSSGTEKTCEDDPILYEYNLWPPYRAINCTSDCNTVYPTKEKVLDIKCQVLRMMYGDECVSHMEEMLKAIRNENSLDTVYIKSAESILKRLKEE